MTTTTTKNPAAVALGRLGGLANRGIKAPGRGFAKPEVMAKALATRKARRLAQETPRK